MRISGKMKTIELLEEALENDLSWRKKEMLQLRLLIEKDQTDEPILLRAGAALLCAHFEGFLKYASNCYIGYVVEQGNLLCELKECFSALALEASFSRCAPSEKVSVRECLIKTYEEKCDKPFFVDYKKGIISTHSNPSSEEIKEILATIGIETELFETKANYIDQGMLEKRHKVVHGERFPVDREDFFSIFDIVIKIIEDYKEVLVSAAEGKQFLREE